MATPAHAPNLVFSHMGITVNDIANMERFYTSVLGFSVTDRGEAGAVPMVFLSRDPAEHHQIVLAGGRPNAIPPNTINANIGACIHHISFRMTSLGDLRDVCDRLEAGGATGVHPANHGIMWSVYAHDPERNLLEFYVYSDWYIAQPFLEPLDFAKTDGEIVALTKELCERSPGYEPLANWRDGLVQRVAQFTEAVSK